MSLPPRDPRGAGDPAASGGAGRRPRWSPLRAALSAVAALGFAAGHGAAQTPADFVDWTAPTSSTVTGTLRGTAVTLAGPVVEPWTITDGTSTEFDRADFTPRLPTGDAVFLSGDTVLTFATPVTNPVIHVGGLGGADITGTLRFPVGTTITKVSGTITVSGREVIGGSGAVRYGTFRLDGTRGSAAWERLCIPDDPSTICGFGYSLHVGVPAPAPPPVDPVTPPPPVAPPPVTPGPSAPPPPEERNLSRPTVVAVGPVAGVADTVRYRCGPGTWSGLAADNAFTYQWYNDDGIRLSDGQPAGPIKVEGGQTLDVGPRRSGKKYFCQVTAQMLSRARLTARSALVVVSSIPREVTLLEERVVGNLFVRGIDVFQTTQANAGAPQYGFGSTPRPGLGFGERCGAGVPTSLLTPGCTLAAGDPQKAVYSGVDLDWLKPTSAVVYVNRDALVAPGTQVEVELQGAVQGRPFFAYPLRRTVEVPTTTSPTFVTLEEREQERFGVRFELPQDWLSQAAFGTIPSLRLRAVVRLPLSNAPDVECPITASCRGDNVFDVGGIPVRRNFHRLRVRALRVLNDDQLPGRANALATPLAAPADTLASARALFPGGSLIQIGAYAGDVDPDNENLVSMSPACLPAGATGPPMGETTDERDRRVRSCRGSAIFNALAAWRATDGNTTGYDVLMGVHRIGTGSGIEPGAARGGLTSATRPGRQPMMHLNDGSLGRPLTAAAHELGHVLGLPHAGQDCPLTGRGESQQGEPWAGDDQGRLQGVLFRSATGDRRVDRDAGVSPASDPLFDLMSYCAAGDSNAWLSPRNWNRIQQQMEILAENPPPTDGPPAARAAQLRSGLVLGTLSDTGQVTIGAVLPAGTAAQDADDDPGSRLRLRAFDEFGRALPESGARLEEITELDGLSGFEVSLPRGATRFELTLGGTVVAARAASRPPRVRITAPRAAGRARRTLAVRWNASDPDGDRLQAVVQFSPGNGGFRTVHVGPSTGTVTVPVGRLQTTRRGRVRVRVSDGFTTATAVSGPFRVDGLPPSVRIVTPGPRSAAAAGGSTLLVGEGTDDAGRPLRGRSLTWFAGPRRLGSGTTVRAVLPAGRVRLRLVARDGQGRRSTAPRTVRVQPVPLEIERLVAPPVVARGARIVTLTIATSTAARLRAGGRIHPVGPRSRRVTITLPRRPSSGLLRVGVRVTADGPRQPPITRTLLIFRR